MRTWLRFIVAADTKWL